MKGKVSGGARPPRRLKEDMGPVMVPQVDGAAGSGDVFGSPLAAPRRRPAKRKPRR